LVACAKTAGAKEAKMSQSITVGRCKTLGTLLIFVLALAVLAGCAGNNPPSSPDKASRVVVRVSGTQDTAYSGGYGDLVGEIQTVNDTLGGEPKEYEVQVQEGGFGVSASFQKTQPGAGEFKAEILADDQLVVESTTYAEFGSVLVDWPSQTGPPGEIPPEALPPEESTGQERP
jgi:hypothetical protein